MSAHRGRRLVEPLSALEITQLMRLVRAQLRADPSYSADRYSEMELQLGMHLSPRARSLHRLHARLWAARERVRGRPVALYQMADGVIEVETLTRCTCRAGGPACDATEHETGEIDGSK